jgi:hypothetical protein
MHSPTPSISSILNINRKLVNLNGLICCAGGQEAKEWFRENVEKNISVKENLLELGTSIFNFDPL